MGEKSHPSYSLGWNTHPFPKLQGAAVRVWGWINDFIPHIPVGIKVNLYQWKGAQALRVYVISCDVLIYNKNETCSKMNLNYIVMHVYYIRNKYDASNICIQVHWYSVVSETVGGPRAAFHAALGYHDFINVTRRILPALKITQIWSPRHFTPQHVLNYALIRLL